MPAVLFASVIAVNYGVCVCRDEHFPGPLGPALSRANLSEYAMQQPLCCAWHRDCAGQGGGCAGQNAAGLQHLCWRPAGHWAAVVLLDPQVTAQWMQITCTPRSSGVHAHRPRSCDIPAESVLLAGMHNHYICHKLPYPEAADRKGCGAALRCCSACQQCQTCGCAGRA